MATVENLPKPELEQSIRKITCHVTEGAVEASKLSATNAEDWMKDAHKCHCKYGRCGGRPGRLLHSLVIGAFAGYHFSNDYTVVQREHAEFASGKGRKLHGCWRQKKGKETSAIQKMKSDIMRVNNRGC